MSIFRPGHQLTTEEKVLRIKHLRERINTYNTRNQNKQAEEDRINKKVIADCKKKGVDPAVKRKYYIILFEKDGWSDDRINLNYLRYDNKPTKKELQQIYKDYKCIYKPRVQEIKYYYFPVFHSNHPTPKLFRPEFHTNWYSNNTRLVYRERIEALRDSMKSYVKIDSFLERIIPQLERNHKRELLAIKIKELRETYKQIVREEYKNLDVEIEFEIPYDETAKNMDFVVKKYKNKEKSTYDKTALTYRCLDINEPHKRTLMNVKLSYDLEEELKKEYEARKKKLALAEINKNKSRLNKLSGV